MARAKGTHHVLLKDADDNNVVGLKLLNQNGQLAYSWKLLPEKVWQVNNWWDGALQFYYDPRNPQMYALADGVWAATENELSLGPRVQPTTLGVKNGGAELGDGTGWSSGNLTIAAATTAPRNGQQHFVLTEVDTNDFMTQELSAADNDSAAPATDIASRFSSQTIVVSCWARLPDSGSAVTIAVTLSETSDSTGTDSGTPVVLTETYQKVTHSRAMGTNVSDLDVRITATAAVGREFYVDEITFDETATATTPVQNPFFEMGSNLGLIGVRNVYLYGEENDYFEFQYRAATDITGHRVWDNRLFLAHGPSTDYEYSDAGAVTTFTDSTLADSDSSATGDNAKFFAFGRTQFAGSYSMYKVLDNDELRATVDPVNSGTAWGATIEVGGDDRAATSVYEILDHIYVAKEDGLYALGTIDFETNLEGMVNKAQGIVSQAGDSNFTRGAFKNAWFYTVTGDTGFWRFDGTNWTDLSPIIASPAFAEVGGKVGAIGSDDRWVYLFVEDRNNYGSDKEGWIYMIREIRTGTTTPGWEVHTMIKVRASRGYGFSTLANSTSRYLFFACDLGDEYFTYRIEIGEKSDTPRRAVKGDGSAAEMETTGTLITPYIDFGDNERVHRLTLVSEDLSGNVTIDPFIELDDDTTFRTFGTSSFTSSPSQTIVEDSLSATVRTAKRMRLRFTLASNSNTTTPVVKRFILYMERKKEWSIIALLADDARQLQGIPSSMTAEKMIERLDTLRDSVPDAPLKFQDLDNTEQRVVIQDMEEVSVMVRPGPAGGLPTYSRGVRITLREAFV